jgi:hypothetical protein
MLRFPPPFTTNTLETRLRLALTGAMAPAFALASAGEADGLNQPVEIMDDILHLRKNVLSDLVDKALRKMEQVLTRQACL